MAEYRATARRRAEQRREERVHRRDRAWDVAREAARILKEEYQVGRVLVFGSLVRDRRFHERSDVDLAVWGLKIEDYLDALGRLETLSPDIDVDIVRVEDAKPGLRDVITQQGILL